MTMLDDRRNINRFAMAAIVFLFLSFALDTVPDAGPLPFLLTLGAIFFSLLAVAVSLRVNRRAAAESAGSEPEVTGTGPEATRALPAKRKIPTGRRDR